MTALASPNQDHRSFGESQSISGLSFAQVKGRFPRLSAAGARYLGREAELHVELPNREAVDIFFQRGVQPVKDPGWRGQAIVTFEGSPLALGIIAEHAGELVLESHIPKANHLEVGRSAFERGDRVRSKPT